MNIAIIGNDASLHEAKSKLGTAHQYFHANTLTSDLVSQNPDVVFDFNPDRNAETATSYSNISAPVFLNTVFSTLSESKINTKGSVFGFCGLPTFFNRSRLEVVSRKSDKLELAGILDKLKVDFTLVRDQVGMITPRVICMIINEAYEALQQGVATREDIDLSMKLGTNYPFGPFEWGDKIGLDNLRKLMLALKNSTKDSRFNPNF